MGAASAAKLLHQEGGEIGRECELVGRWKNDKVGIALRPVGHGGMIGRLGRFSGLGWFRILV